MLRKSSVCSGLTLKAPFTFNLTEKAFDPSRIGSFDEGSLLLIRNDSKFRVDLRADPEHNSSGQMRGEERGGGGGNVGALTDSNLRGQRAATRVQSTLLVSNSSKSP